MKKRVAAIVLSIVMLLATVPSFGVFAAGSTPTASTMSDYADMRLTQIEFTATDMRWFEKVYRVADQSASKPYVITFDYYLIADSGVSVSFDSRGGYCVAASGSSNNKLVAGKNTFNGRFYTSHYKDGTFAPMLKSKFERSAASNAKATLYMWNYSFTWEGKSISGSTQDAEPSAKIVEAAVSGFPWYDGDAPVVEQPITDNTAIKYNEKHSTLDDQGEEMRQEIINNTDDLAPSVTGKTYYISPTGKNSNDGLSPATAWRTLDAVSANSHKFKAGDVVLFERGGVYRGTTQVTSGVSYGAYGTGPKPCLYASPRNYADPDLWEKVGTNIWRVYVPYLADIGNIVFDHGEVCASDYKIVEDDKMRQSNLKKNFQYYHMNSDEQDGYIDMYYKGGNPGELFDDIEFCVKEHVFYMAAGSLKATDIVIDNLCIKYSGSFGIVFRRCEDITVTNCEIGYIGGSEFNETNADGTISYGRYGNGIEFNSHATDILVEGNWIYQCYDAGYTNQGEGANHINILVRDNLVEYCNYNFEIFGAKENADGTISGAIKNCIYEDNMLRFAGYGFGTNNRVGSSDIVTSSICYWYSRIPSEDTHIRNNILDTSYRYLLVSAYVNNQNELAPYVHDNTWVQHKGPKSAVALQVDTKVHGWLTFADHELASTDQYTMERSVAVVDTNPTAVVYNGPGLNGIVVTAKPNKTAYLVGEKLDTTGMKLEMQFNGGTTQSLTRGYTVTAPDMSTLGEKTVTVTYSNKTATFKIVVAEPASEMQLQPIDVTTAKNAIATFKVALSGTNLTYQWQVKTSEEAAWKNTGEPGNKTAMISVTAYTPYDGYQYRCVVTDAFGTKVASEPATLTVVTTKIAKQPSDAKVAENATVTFSVSATGVGLTYQWQVKTSSKGSWANTTTTGYKTNKITVKATAAQDGYQYRCIVTDAADGELISSVATLMVVDSYIITQPTSIEVVAGTKATFSVVATGLGLQYQWQIKTSSSAAWKNTTTTGYKTSTITVDATAARSGYQYRCIVTDAVGKKMTSAAAKLTAVATKITTQPKSATVAKGTVVNFKVVATGLGLKYQWQMRYSSTSSWQTLHVGTYNQPTYTVTASGSVNGYQYRCVVTDAAGVKYTSSPATMTSVTLKITKQPTNAKVSASAKPTFSVSVTGVGVKYQWQIKTSSTGAWKNTTTTGYNTNKITISATAARNGYQYRCIVTDAMGSQVTSSAATLTVVTTKITKQPTSLQAAASTKPKFMVAATGLNLKYQWQVKTSSTASWKNTTTTGYSTNEIIVTATTAHNGYQYRCVVTDAAGKKFYSSAAKLTVLSLKITTQPKSVKTAKNTNVTFTIGATGLAVKYQWQVRYSATDTWRSTYANGYNTAKFKVNATASVNGYQYRCIVTDAAGNKKTSSVATLTVVSPRITTQPKNVSIAKNKKATFTVAATGLGLKYQWQVMTSSTGAWKNTTVTGYKTKTITVSTTAKMNGYQYRCIVTDSAGNKVTSSVAKLTVK